MLTFLIKVKPVVSLVLLMTLSTYSFGQLDTFPDFEEKEKKRYRLRNKTRIFLLDLGINTYLYDGSLTLPDQPFDNYLISDLELNYARSINVNVHLYQQRIDLYRGLFNIHHGVYFDINNYRFEDNVRLIPGENQLAVVRDQIEYKKNRLTTTYLTVPIMFSLRSNPRRPSRSFRVSGGAYGGLLIYSGTRQKSEEFGREMVRDDFNLNKFRWGIRGEIGLGPLNFYVTYSRSTLFREGQGPELYPLNFGIILVPF